MSVEHEFEKMKCDCSSFSYPSRWISEENENVYNHKHKGIDFMNILL